MRHTEDAGESKWDGMQVEYKSICCNAAHGNLTLQQEGLIHSPGVVSACVCVGGGGYRCGV